MDHNIWHILVTSNGGEVNFSFVCYQSHLGQGYLLLKLGGQLVGVLSKFELLYSWFHGIVNAETQN